MKATLVDEPFDEPGWLFEVKRDGYRAVAKAEIEKKREIIGSMFPEKICFDGTENRTGKVNEAMVISQLINSKLQGKKWGNIKFI